MKKITGKVVSLVLALALVVTSFSATFAFASTKSVTGTVSDTKIDEIYLTTGVATKDSAVIDTLIDGQLDTKDHQDVSGEKITAISHASGDSLVKWDISDTNVVTLTLKSTSKTGKEVLSILYEGTYTNDDGDEVTVKGRKNFTVNVVKQGDIVIGNAYATQTDLDARDGKSIETSTFAQTQNSVLNVGFYKVDVGTDARTVYTPVTVTTKDSGIATGTGLSVAVTSGDVHFGATLDTATPVPGDSVAVKVGKGTADGSGNYAYDGGVANVTITAKKLVTDGHSAYKASSDSDDKYTYKTKIEKKIDVKTLFPSATSFTVDKDGSKTMLYQVGNSTGVVVTGTELSSFPNGTTSVTVNDGSLKKISGSIGTLTINDGTVSAVDVDNTNVIVNDGSVGDVTTDGTTGTVDVVAGKVGNIDTTDVDGDSASTVTGNVTVNGGTVGTIDSNDAVVVEATDEDTPISTGKITSGDVTVFSSDAKVSVNGIKASEDGTITIKGETTSVGAIDMDYREVTLALGDSSDSFVGTIAAPANATKATITTENEDTVATVTGAVDVDTISVGSDSNLKFTDAITVDSIDGDGTLTIAAGKLYVTGSVAGTTLKLSDKSLAKGTTVFKADTDTVAADDFTTYGFTLAMSSGSSVDTFKIDTLNFAGITIDNTDAKVAVGYSQTFTASAYPIGTTAPAGSTIKWDFDGSDDVFDVTYSGNTATVKVKAIDSTFESENEGTLTATLYDADGYVLDDYSEATSTVKAIAVPEATSDTHNDLSVGKGASYTFKITSATAPSFTTGTAGIFTVALASHTGNDYFYKITATGNVGASTGIYLNGTKLLVASVKSAFTVDTTKDTTVKGSYTLKVTSATTPTFGVGTAGVFKAEFVSKSGNNYFYKLTSVGAVGTKAGIFVDGTKVFVATVG